MQGPRHDLPHLNRAAGILQTSRDLDPKQTPIEVPQ